MPRNERGRRWLDHRSCAGLLLALACCALLVHAKLSPLLVVGFAALAASILAF